MHAARYHNVCKHDLVFDHGLVVHPGGHIDLSGAQRALYAHAISIWRKRHFLLDDKAYLARLAQQGLPDSLGSTTQTLHSGLTQRVTSNAPITKDPKSSQEMGCVKLYAPEGHWRHSGDAKPPSRKSRKSPRKIKVTLDTESSAPTPTSKNPNG